MNCMMAGLGLNALIDEVVFCQDYSGRDYSGNLVEAWRKR
jgi:hypothetical protein